MIDMTLPRLLLGMLTPKRMKVNGLIPPIIRDKQRDYLLTSILYFKKQWEFLIFGTLLVRSGGRGLAAEWMKQT
jgi:hypothetical protein